MLIRNILLPIDFSERSRAAAPFVYTLAKLHDAKVTLVHAFEPLPAVAAICQTEPDIFNFERWESELRELLAKFVKSELPNIATSMVVRTGAPVDVIRSEAAAIKADLVAMPTHGYGGFRRLFLGSVTAKVLHELSIPVWTDAHTPEPSHRAHPMPRRILTAVDLKGESGRITEFALQLGRDTGAQVEVVHAAPEGVIVPELPKFSFGNWSLSQPTHSRSRFSIGVQPSVWRTRIPRHCSASWQFAEELT